MKSLFRQPPRTFRLVGPACAAALLFSAGASRLQAQQTYASGMYSQTFDTLPNTNSTAGVNASASPTINGVTYVLPSGSNATNVWLLSNTASGATSPYNSGGSGTVAFGTGLAGWYAEGSVADQAGASYGDQSKGGLISFGGLNNTNRAIGLLGTSTSGSNVFGLELTNTSGGILNSITLSYTGELFRQTSTANPLNFGYLVDNTGAVTAPKAGSTIAAGTTAVTALNVSFATGSSSTGTSGGTPVATQSISQTLSISNWNNNGDLFLTWDQAGPGSAQGIGIDGFSFSASLTLTPANVTWAVTNGTWNTTAANWTGGTPTPNLYKDGDFATFNNTSGGTVMIATALSPGGTTDSATSGTYSFTGAGSIGGSGSLTKSGGGTLDLTGMSAGNAYAGGTNLNGGTVIVSNDNQLGSAAGPLIFAGGTLQTNTTGIASARNVTVNTGGGTFSTSGLNSSTSGTTAINDTFTTNGIGNLTLNGAVSFGTSAGSLSISAGSVTLGSSAGTINMYNGGTFNGNLVVSSGVPRINFDGSTTYTGSGQIQAPASGLTISNTSGSAGGTVNANIFLNSTALGFTKGDVTVPTYAPGNFVTNIGGTKGVSGSVNTLTVGGIISGNSDVNFGNSATGGGAGNLLLNAQNTYSGTSTINTSGNIILGVNNGLPTTTDVIFGTLSGVGATQLDLNGHTQNDRLAVLRRQRLRLWSDERRSDRFHVDRERVDDSRQRFLRRLERRGDQQPVARQGRRQHADPYRGEYLYREHINLRWHAGRRDERRASARPYLRRRY